MRWLSLLVVVGLIVASGCGETKKSSSKDGKESLKLTGPATTNITQGEKTEITVKVTRKGFDDDVKLTISDLPDGVKLQESSPKIPKGTEDIKLHLEADAKAPVKSGTKSKVTAKGGSLEDTVEFTVNVKEKK